MANDSEPLTRSAMFSAVRSPLADFTSPLRVRPELLTVLQSIGVAATLPAVVPLAVLMARARLATVAETAGRLSEPERLLPCSPNHSAAEPTAESARAAIAR